MLAGGRRGPYTPADSVGRREEGEGDKRDFAQARKSLRARGRTRRCVVTLLGQVARPHDLS